MPTKQDELLKAQQELIEQLAAKVDKLEIEMQEAPQGRKSFPEKDLPFRREDHPDEGGGWVIQSPKDSYTGKTAGVSFVGGYAIVYEDDENADRKVHQLQHDFGYTVTSLDKDGLYDARKLVQRAQETARTDQTLLEKLSG